MSSAKLMLFILKSKISTLGVQSNSFNVTDEHYSETYCFKQKKMFGVARCAGF